MDQIRICTLAASQAAKEYCDVCRPKHINSFYLFGITTKAVYLEQNTKAETKILAIVFCPGNASPCIRPVWEVRMDSADFRQDMAGFDFRNILNAAGILCKEVC